MSERIIHMRTPTVAYKKNLKSDLDDFYNSGLLENQNMTEYIIAAIDEKRERDKTKMKELKTQKKASKFVCY